MAFHGLRTGSEVSTSRRRAAVAGKDGRGIDGRQICSGQGHLKRLEKVELSEGGQQALSLAAIDFVSKQMALERVFTPFKSSPRLMVNVAHPILGGTHRRS